MKVNPSVFMYYTIIRYDLPAFSASAVLSVGTVSASATVTTSASVTASVIASGFVFPRACFVNGNNFAVVFGLI